MEEAYIVGYARTAFGSFGGRWRDVPATQLAADAVKEALARAALPTALPVDALVLGVALPAGLGQCPAATVARLAGLPPATVAWDVGKVCASGARAAMCAADAVRTRAAQVVVAVGAESMSRVPHALAVRWGARFGDVAASDLLQADGLTDAGSGKAMGLCAEETAEAHGISRGDADAYARRSFEAAMRHREDIARELLPGGPQEDESVSAYRPEKMGGLRTPFKAGGTVTAANASPISDGAAALVLASRAAVIQHCLRPLARIAGYADASQDAERFTTAPALAIPRALARAGLPSADVYEINEAFAAVAIANARILDIPLDRLNVRGGAIALGHPLGASGARIVGALACILRDSPAWRTGVAAVCNGGGGASALVLVRDDLCGGASQDAD